MSHADLQRQITIHQRRLQILKEQQATKGISTDPAITIEIGDIETQLAELYRQVGGRPDSPVANKAPPPALSALQQQRLADLQRNLEQDAELLRDYEDMLRLEDDPRRMKRYRKEIERQKRAIADYEQQLAEIIPATISQPEAMSEQIQQTLAAMQSQIAALEERLVAGQQDLSQQMSQQQDSLLSHIDTRHHETLQRTITQLKANQLETVDLLYDVVDRQQLAQWELDEITTVLQQSLAQLKDVPNAVYWQQLLTAAEGSTAVEQKLKLMLPLIPFLLEYELELRADTLPALQKVWQRLRAKIQREPTGSQ